MYQNHVHNTKSGFYSSLKCIHISVLPLEELLFKTAIRIPSCPVVLLLEKSYGLRSLGRLLSVGSQRVRRD